MKLERIDPNALDLATATHAADVTRAEMAADGSGAIAPSAGGLFLQARHGHDQTPFDGMWLVRDDTVNDQIVGHASVEVSRWDNPQLAMLFCHVHPVAYGEGVGILLLEAQITRARELGCSSIFTFTDADGHAAGFLTHQGFAIAQHEAQRRLDPQRLDYAHIAQLAAEAADSAEDYELVRLDGPADESVLAELVTVFEAINDAPTDGLDMSPGEFPVDRLRRYDAAMLARRQHVYRILARHRRTSEWAGHTIVCVDETRPGYAIQEDTSVRSSHRGHRLGLGLKASMLLWLREVHPELTAIDTWNAVSNHHMIAVNEALGCEVSRLGVAMQRAI